MRKLFGVAGALALALLVASPAMSRQEKGKAGCPMAKKEAGQYCEKCAALVDKKDIKDGKCGKDQSALEKVEVCIKSHYVCGCGKSCCTDDKPAPGKCKCAKPLKEEVLNSLINYTCAGCGAASPVKDKVKHKDDCKKKDVIKTSCTH